VTECHDATADTWTYYNYDANGNMLHIQKPAGTTYFEYNDAQLVENIHYSDDTWAYFHYDALRRCAVNDGSGMSYFTWDANGVNLLSECDESGTVTAKYTHGYTPIEGIGSLVQAELIDSGTSYYQYPVYDHRGSVAKLVDEDEATVGEYTYNAFGEILDETVPPEGNRFTWQSNWISLKENLYLSPSRVYSAELGRFIQRDPLPKVVARGGLGFYERSIFAREMSYNLRHYSSELSSWLLTIDPLEEGGGENLFAMGYNNPIKYFDIKGLEGTKECKCPTIDDLISSCPKRVVNMYKKMQRIFRGFGDKNCDEPTIVCDPCKRKGGKYDSTTDTIFIYTKTCAFDQAVSIGCHELVHAFDDCYGLLGGCKTIEDITKKFATEVRAKFTGQGKSRKEACRYAFTQTYTCTQFAIIEQGGDFKHEAFMHRFELKRKCLYDNNFWNKLIN
jgi:RHS repeat-associated protein